MSADYLNMNSNDSQDKYDTAHLGDEDSGDFMEMKVPEYQPDESSYGSNEQKDYDQEYTPYTISSVLANANRVGQSSSSAQGVSGISSPNTAMTPVSSYGGVDYLFMDEHKKRGERGFNEKLCYNTGTLYGVGLTAGGAWGAYEGVKQLLKNGGQNVGGIASATMAQSASSAASPPMSSKLKLNTVLNCVTRRGPQLGNQAGVLTLMFTMSEHLLGKMLFGEGGNAQILNNTISGVVAGVLYKSSSGMPVALRTGGVLGAFAGIGSAIYQIAFSS
ncbi:hypothetical protein MIR68_004523 [Amoeboaphelidium protococcarum]|nr:hypothetical protein MIR68_004523 [Amoeboaphelidium protococcarum]